MMTREEIAAIDRACEEQHISQQEYLDSHGIAKHQYYRWKRKYREEDEQLSEEEQAALDAALPRYPLELSALFFASPVCGKSFIFRLILVKWGGVIKNE